MDRSRSRIQDESRAVLKAIAAKIAIFIGVLSAIFYIALTTTADPLAALSPVDTGPLELSHAVVEVQPVPQRVPGYLPGGYVNQAKGEDGKLSPFEDD